MFFIPLFDDNPTGSRPYVSWLILISCILVFFWQISLSPALGQLAAYQYGVVPALLFGHEALPAEIARVPAWASIFTSMFLHGDWMHLIFNMLYLWIFADNVEVAMGRVRFILFYACCGIAAALLQGLIDTSSTIPMIGASGGIAGILGAYIMLHPRASVRVFMIILIFIRIISLPAWLVLGVWILGQFAAAPTAFSGGGGVAYFAHIGGFLAGMALVPFFKQRDIPLFDGDKPQADAEQRWSSTPISLQQLRSEARQRYTKLEAGPRSGSVPAFRRRPPGPWG